MNRIDLGQAIGILANIGVIAGIVFLAFELRQNNQLLSAESRATRHQARMELVEVYFQAETASLLTKASAGEELSAAQRHQLRFLYNMTMTAWEWSYLESLRGLVEITDGDISTYRNNYRGAIPGLADYWQSRRETADPRFVQWFEDNVVR